MGLIIPNNASGATKVYCVSQTSLPDLKSIHTEYLSKHFSTKRLRTFVEKAQKEAKVPITCPPRTDWFSRLSHSVGKGPSFRERSRLEKKEPSETDKARNASATERRAQRLRKLGALLTAPWEPEREVDTNASTCPCPCSLVGLSGFCPLSCRD